MSEKPYKENAIRMIVSAVVLAGILVFVFKPTHPIGFATAIIFFAATQMLIFGATRFFLAGSRSALVLVAVGGIAMFLIFTGMFNLGV